MATNKHKTVFYSDKILLKKLDKFWHKYEFSSRSKAIVWLVSWALAQNPIPPPQRDDDEYYE